MFAFFINHILGHVPYYFWPFLIGVGIAVYAILGIAGVVASIVPTVKPYISWVRAASIAVVFFSVFMFGAEGTINVYKAEHLKDVGIVAVGTQASKDATVQVATELNGKQVEVKIKTVYIDKYIHDNAGAINADCNAIDDTAFDAYNQAVTNRGDKK